LILAHKNPAVKGFWGPPRSRTRPSGRCSTTSPQASGQSIVQAVKKFFIVCQIFVSLESNPDIYGADRNIFTKQAG
jgi:hypothetical protein